jgi:hypothetical protein
MAPVKQANKPITSVVLDLVAQTGETILRQLAPSLQQRGVPRTNYIIVNTANGEFVTGKSEAEARQRFTLMHPGVEGWMQQFGAVIDGPDAPVATIEAATDSAPPVESNEAAGSRQRRGKRPFARLEHAQFQSRA